MLLNAGQNLSGPAFLAQLRTASIGGSVLDSTTHAGISGVSVHLSDGANTTTDSSGGYLFGGLAAGRYDVGFTPPPGYVNVGSNPITATLSAGQAVTGGDFAAAPNVGSISVVVCQGWSGKCSGPGLAGVGVVVTNVVSGTTDGSGAAGFSGLTPGTYTVDYAPPGNYINTGSQPQTVTVTGLHTASVTFTAQPNVGTIDVQVCTPGSSAGTCYALSGISVSVQGPTTASGTTDSAGNAVFGGLAAGTYSVGYTPSGCTPDRSTPNPQTVTVSFGQTVSVVFSCWVLL